MTTVAAAGSTPTAPRPVTPMSILASRLQLLDQAIDALEVDTSIKSELRDLCDLAAGLDPYLRRCTTARSPGLLLQQSTAAADWTERSPTAVYLEQGRLDTGITLERTQAVITPAATHLNFRVLR